jgi:hypothetical protein
VSGEDARVVLEMFTEGVISGLAVSERGAGANISVDVSVGSAIVEGANTDQGKYLAKIAGATSFNVPLDAADVSNPRIDEVYVVVQDDGYDSSGNVVPRLAVRDGTPASSPSAPGPDGAWDAYLLLASIAIAANETQIEDADITDERVTTAAADGTVQTASIADDAVTTAKIADEAVGFDQIGVGAVGSSRIMDAGVGQIDLAGNITGAFLLTAGDSGSPAISTSEGTVESVAFTIPAGWTTWTCMAWYSGVVAVIGSVSSYTLKIQVDGVDGPNSTYNFTPDGNSMPISLVHHRTGITATGSRTIAVRGVRVGAGSATLTAASLTALAIRTS